MVKMLIHFSGYRWRHRQLQIRQGGSPDGLHGAKVLQQRLAPHLTHPGNILQSRAHGAAAVALMMVGDGKAVGLLLDAANEGEYRLVLLDERGMGRVVYLTLK